MNKETKEICELLDRLADASAYDLELSNGSVVKCKQLSTSQLREFVKTIADSPLTQVVFNSTTTKIFKESIINLPTEHQLNVFDRLLFLIETRIRSISPFLELTNSDNETTSVDLNAIKAKLLTAIKQNQSILEKKPVVSEQISLTVESPTLDTEQRLNEEIYKDLNIAEADSEQVKQLIADFFVYEIVKHILSITIEGEVIDFSNHSFKDRVNILQKLPAKCTQEVIDYIEKQTLLLDDVLTINGMYLSIDSSFFAIY